MRSFIETKMGEEVRKPIGHTVEAKPHTPVYRMHRYFARRPYSVFRELVNYYTREGDIVLDPFCGGGVTILEGLRLRRKVVGIDLNPMATFITKVECMPIKLEQLMVAFDNITDQVRKEIEKLYDVACPKCKNIVSFDWMEWSHVYQCPNCKKNVVIVDCKKKGNGRYECSFCKHYFVVTNTKRVDEKPTKIKLVCDICKYKGIKTPDKFDVDNAERIKNNFLEYIRSKNLGYPQEYMPMEYDLRRPYNYSMKKFVDFLSKRNLIGVALLFKEINRIKDKEVRYIMLNIFTSTLSWVTKLCVDPGHGWPISAYWVADIHYELNVWRQFNNRFKWFLRGKEYSNREVGDYFKEARSFEQLENNATAWILTKSSARLPMPDNSVDAVITDPPYGWNVKYSELSNFSIIWLKELFGVKMMDNDEEAIISEYQEKDSSDYENLLYGVFRECYRVLKRNKWMVMTFNNKESCVWMALLRAVQRAGFYLPEDGIIYQEPIKHYTNTLYQRREGSVLGDFIYSFQKREHKHSRTRHLTNGQIEETISGVASDVIGRNGGASTSEIYQHVVPRLFNNYLITEEKDLVPDVEEVLRREFKFKKIGSIGKWVNK